MDELGSSVFVPLRRDEIDHHLNCSRRLHYNVPLSFIHQGQFLPHNLHDGRRNQGVEFTSDANRLDSRLDGLERENDIIAYG